MEDAAYESAKELAEESARGDAHAVQLIDQILEKQGRNRDDIMLDALPKILLRVEGIDRQIAAAESRRNSSLREIDRRRVVLGEALRRALPEVELKVIESKPSGDNEPGDAGNSALAYPK